MQKPLTPRESLVFEYIKGFREEKGYAPTVRDVQQHFGWKSPNAAWVFINKIQTKGWMKPGPEGSRRTMICDPPAASRGEVSAALFAAFEKGKTPIEVVIELKMPAQEVSLNYDLWLKLTAGAEVMKQVKRLGRPKKSAEPPAPAAPPPAERPCDLCRRTVAQQLDDQLRLVKPNGPAARICAGCMTPIELTAQEGSAA